ncbi:MAG TPA: single-stranded DNA-binding protein [Longimicrobiaceae bacterium]|nr:single-stranded DNA-binding protein [Longimicrobiaceae bacterium]
MSRSLNKVMLIGNVGSDPEVRAVGTGSRVAQFSVATSRRWNDRNGQPQEKTEWHRVVAWDKPFNLVDVVERFVKKGDRLYVEGEIEYRQYQDKDGVTKYSTEIRAREIVLLGGKGEGGGGGGFESGSGSAPRARSGGGGGGAPAGAGAKGGGGYDGYEAPAFEDDDDLPF